jgi:hypothetical protein
VRREVKPELSIAAVGELVTASHDELESVTFTTLVAAHVHTAGVGDDFQVADARLETPSPVGIENVRILSGYALHAFY